MERLKNFSFDEWRRRYMNWHKDNRARITDFFRRQDRDHDGKISREEFIEGILSTSKLTLEIFSSLSLFLCSIWSMLGLDLQISLKIYFIHTNHQYNNIFPPFFFLIFNSQDDHLIVKVSRNLNLVARIKIFFIIICCQRIFELLFYSYFYIPKTNKKQTNF